MWWIGPEWLRKSTQYGLNQNEIPSITSNREERIISAVATTQPTTALDLTVKYSNFGKLLRITAICKRFIALCMSRLQNHKNKQVKSLSELPISPEELNNSKLYWTRVVQQQNFRKEIDLLTQKKNLPNSSSLVRLTPFVDSNGLLRVGGRLQAATLPSDSKHPLILPKDCSFTQLIIADIHNRTLHGGTQGTLFHIRSTFWIIGGRIPIKSFISKCVKCVRFRQQRAEQLMGQLPVHRINPSHPFLHSGVDYAGPFLLKTWKGRAARSYKGYIALFVCESISAIHLEVVTDYSAESFIAAYKRFCARRGICATLRSDCGTNLKGADSEVQALFSLTSQEFGKLSSLLAHDGTEWIFNPPEAPHFGGK